MTLLTPSHPVGPAIIWADTQPLLNGAGQPAAEATTLLDAGCYVVAVTAFNSAAFPGEPNTQPATAKKSSNPPYSGYFSTYNRTTMANRVHDLLTAMAFSRTLPKVSEVRLIGRGDEGPAALLARALAGKAVTRAAIALNHFDFDQVTEPTDPRFIPGGRKYGGIYGFVPLMEGQTLIMGARETGRYDLARQTPGVTLEPQTRSPAATAAWLLK